MKKKILAALLGITVSLPVGSFCANAIALEKAEDKLPIYVMDCTADETAAIALKEGGSVQLVIPDADDMYYIAFNSRGKKAAVTSDLKLTGISAGEDIISIYGYSKETDGSRQFNIKVSITENPDISPEVRAEVNRLGQLDGYYRRQLELLGAVDEAAPRLDMDKVQEILDTSDGYFDIFAKLNEYQTIADVMPTGGGMTSYTYWFDPKGNESVTWYLEQELVTYTKTADDGTLIGGQLLYPDKGEYFEYDGEKNYGYVMYNQITETRNAVLKLNFIDRETGKPFTETNGRFELAVQGGSEAVKSWDASEGATAVVSELPIENTYELRYIDEYHEDEKGELYKYEVVTNKGTHIYYFSSAKEYEFDVYLKRHYINDPVLIMGDANGDEAFNIADVVVFQKWLLGDKGAVIANDKAVDFYGDEKLNVYDLCLMKKAVIEAVK